MFFSRIMQVVVVLLTTCCSHQVASLTTQKYLDSLSGTQTPLPEPKGYEALVPEEYYGVTNPMANSWAGSKHEQYGGYLHKLEPSSSKDRWQPASQPDQAAYEE